MSMNHSMVTFSFIKPSQKTLKAIKDAEYFLHNIVKAFFFDFLTAWYQLHDFLFPKASEKKNTMQKADLFLNIRLNEHVFDA